VVLKKQLGIDTALIKLSNAKQVLFFYYGVIFYWNCKGDMQYNFKIKFLYKHYIYVAVAYA
jgi:hypothetical protein